MMENHEMPDFRRRNVVSTSIICFFAIVISNVLHFYCLDIALIIRNILIAIVSASIIYLMTETARMHKSLANFKNNDFLADKNRIIITALFFVVYSFVPLDYSLPLIFPFLLTSVCGLNITLTITQVLVLNNLIINSADNMLIVAHTLLVFLAVIISDIMKGYKKQCFILLFLASFITSIAERYSIGTIPDYKGIIIIAVVSLGYSLLCILISIKNSTQFTDTTDNTDNNFIHNIKQSSDINTKEIIDYNYYISDSYPLVKDIQKYDLTEYNHARNLQRAASICVKAIGGNSELAEMAGFYYRLGTLQGEPVVDNSLKIAYDYCFPETVINILEEYDAINRIPQSKESAIIHMANQCLIKAEMLRAKKLSSNWNQDMVIYQTLNELSATGIYDDSGISMNQFLIVRDILVKEGLNV